MQKRESNIVDIDEMMNERFGAVGTESRNEFRKEAYNYCVGQLILEARKQESMTQAELAEKIGTNKSYISRIEKGQIEPGASTFLRIIEALGLRFEIVKPMTYALHAGKVSGYLSDDKTQTYSSLKDSAKASK
ncbi:MAG: helix-turn-helix transcriptional regulator [Bacteroidales bacterium]|nr:helix-turn-helix transcriptional regulator [Candidatus Cacconaster merdequi]